MLVAVGCALIVAGCAPGGPVLDEPRAASTGPRVSVSAEDAVPDSDEAVPVGVGQLSLAVVGETPYIYFQF